MTEHETGQAVNAISNMPAPVVRILAEVCEELRRAMVDYRAMASEHEGYAVLKEELDELWDEIRKKQDDRDPEALSREAIQVAAMAVRFVHDLPRDANDVDPAYANLSPKQQADNFCGDAHEDDWAEGQGRR